MTPSATLRSKLADVPTKREANKLEKLRRIQDAAQELFVLHGYDNTTVREIAARAEVALGTLFLYASNKRDLLFLIANEIMEGAVEEAISLVDDQRGLVHNLTLIAGVHFRVFGEKPELFRLVLRELLFYNTGEQGVRAVKNRARLMSLIQRVVARAAQSGEIRPDADPEFVARVLFGIIQAEIRLWIATEHRALSTGLASFWAAATLVMNGVASRPTPASASSTELRRVVARLTPTASKR